MGRTGKLWPARTSGVAKSARELAKSSSSEFATPGIDSGSVTVRKTRPGEAPSDSPASSRFGPTADRTAASVRKETGKYVSVSESHVPQKP